MDIPIYILNHKNEERKKRMENRLKGFNVTFLKSVNIDPNKYIELYFYR